MGCGCKGGSAPKVKKEGESSNVLRNIGVGIGATILGVLITPIIAWVTIKAMYNTWAGDGNGLPMEDIIKMFSKVKPTQEQEEDEEEINPEDYELVGVDKIND